MPRKRKPPEPPADALAPALTEADRRRLGKRLLRGYVLQGEPPGRAIELTRKHPSLASKPPSARAVQDWLRQLRGAGSDLIDDDVRSLPSHPIEDHRRAAISRTSARVAHLQAVVDGLREDLAEARDREAEIGDALALLDPDDPAQDADRARALADLAAAQGRVAQVEDRLLKADQRLEGAEKHHARITSIDSQPLEAHLGEDAERARLVSALVRSAHLFEFHELSEVLEAFAAERARREEEARARGAIEVPERRRTVREVLGVGPEDG